MTKRTRRWSLAGLTVLALLILGPTLASYEPLRDWVLRSLLPPLDGKVSTDDGSFAWLRSQKVEGLDLRASDGDPLVTVGATRVDRSLWQLLTDRGSLGHVEIDRPHVQLMFDADGRTKLAKAFRNDNSQSPPQPPPNVRLDVTGAEVSWRAFGEPQTTNVHFGPVHVEIDDVPGSPGKREARIAETTLLDREHLSLGLARDVLAFINPLILNARGSVSLHVGEGRIPLEDWRAGTLSGELTLHTVEFSGEGPVVEQLAGMLGSSKQASFAPEMVIRCRMADRRVYHEGFEFGMQYVRVRTRGSIGLDDQSLDLIATLDMQLPESVRAERPVLRALSEHPLEVPIRGTISHPQVEWGALGDPMMAVLTEAMDVLGQQIGADETTRTVVDNVLGAINKLDAPPEESVPAIAGTAFDLVQQIVAERRRRAEEAAKNGEPPPEVPPRRRALGRLLDRVLEEAEK